MQASVTLWAFPHEAVAVEAAQAFGESKPATRKEERIGIVKSACRQ
jgi:hypothetical protein